jgi:hypothetical protein
VQQSVHASLTTFERAIEDKVSDRVAVIEKAMPDQSAVVAALSQRALELDLNLQRLIAMVEKLCERTGAGPDPRGWAKQSSFRVSSNEAA